METPQLPPRPPAGHKGTFGTVAVVGGSSGPSGVMLGAPVLAARAALRSGVGLCRLVLPRPLLVPGLALVPSATGIGFDGAAPAPDAADTDADAWVIGPGLSGASAPKDTETVLELIVGTRSPSVLDADALNAIARSNRRISLPGRVLTPHPGEAERLARCYGVRFDTGSPQARVETARRLAEATAAVVVLKGAGTVVAEPDAPGWTCRHGHACLATGGTGDVLAGLLGGLLAQSVAGDWPLTPAEVARCAVDAHARAAERWSQTRGAEAGLLAQELADLLPETLRRPTEAKGSRPDRSG